jgi:hypothetical protein
MNTKTNDLTHVETSLGNLDKRLSDFLDKQDKRTAWKDIWIPLFATIVALTGVLSGVVIQQNTISTQLEMNRFQVTFDAKQKGYADFMSSLQNALTKSMEQDNQALVDSTDTLPIKFSYGKTRVQIFYVHIR